MSRKLDARQTAINVIADEAQRTWRSRSSEVALATFASGTVIAYAIVALAGAVTDLSQAVREREANPLAREPLPPSEP